ncbi:BlaI/MecI/CopY family transcriptional regulator [Pseudoalteromonas sp. MMG013]|uniref:BlaI/MecI/CopY family transcriptional regulator n=1 Tax=unclassified Pseudoalteromonas TaxID=194690 RepID=UPI001B38EBC6|nr:MULTISPECIES: BlaI/MecI/CopY family transcriptional regulator [unclassified Pseudoalteromonas]MBQ4847593.1 BlaI/MecI/CopY family transcriptional regulator [Pseudoalteromonas sp. MMG005]MBQ4852274.1 BlaI/MecI/CopY family transcriptional regulator [Pseudoalteromonas sp. MMG012]MBQ4861058.1 BlaI/MecI/CopY family transcriptional regulator [Pseudoalteromonas sp. MMG013]
MARKKSTQLTDSEQSIMEILWHKEQASVREITAALSEEKATAYTTVQTMCKILADKDYVDFRKEGKAFIYTPKITQKEARKGALTSLLNKFFGGSPEVLAQHLIQETDIELDDLAELQKHIDRADD